MLVYSQSGAGMWNEVSILKFLCHFLLDVGALKTGARSSTGGLSAEVINDEDTNNH